jgi:hypothetical protein
MVACGQPSRPVTPVADGSDRTTSPSPAVTGTATTVTPQPQPTGTADGRSPTPTQTKSAPPGTGSTVTVTESDSGDTIRLKVGQRLQVRLPAEYRQATATYPSVLVRTSATGGYPSDNEMVAVFEARQDGTTDVESSTDYACLHATPSCALPQRLWSVHVVVTR